MSSKWDTGINYKQICEIYSPWTHVRNFFTSRNRSDLNAEDSPGSKPDLFLHCDSSILSSPVRIIRQWVFIFLLTEQEKKKNADQRWSEETFSTALGSFQTLGKYVSLLTDCASSKILACIL